MMITVIPNNTNTGFVPPFGTPNFPMPPEAAKPNMPPIQRGDVHVVPYGKSWVVEYAGGNDEPLYMADTQKDAIRFGIETAREGAALLIIHGQDGRFRDVRNYTGHHG